MDREAQRYVFGPVSSRRLGQSLGVDPIPPKTCNWNCVYCQLGRTVPLQSERGVFLPTEDLLREVGKRLSHLEPGELDWVTFVGSGEPLLHSEIGRMIRDVKDRTDVPVAVITNGALLCRPDVREEVSAADAVLPTLDAGSHQLFRRINRPHPGISFLEYVKGLIAFRQMYSGRLLLEVMLVRGLNDSEAALEMLAELAEEIHPDEVHISLPERPPAEPWVHPADAEGVLRASAILGQVSKVLSPGADVLDLHDPAGAVEALVEVISRHPLSQSQIVHALAGQTREEREEILEAMKKSDRVQRIHRYGRTFWVPSTGHFPGT